MAGGSRSAGAPLAITMGDPAGVGGELVLKAWLDRERGALPPFFVIDDPSRLERLADDLGLEVSVKVIDGPEDAIPAFARAVPVLALELAAEVRPGEPDPANAAAVIESIESAAALALAGSAAGLVTNPIQKSVLYEAGFAHPGHTEYLAEIAGRGSAVMMLLCPGLKVALASVHVPLKEALAALTTETIVDCAVTVATALDEDFGIAGPRLAIAGINPHAGEDGRLGREEVEVIGPAVEEIRRRGVDAFGPAAADTLFHKAARERYDAAICMYHDQALIPLKTLDFDHGVNVTLGLPLVRTSPDHGTALGLAGSGRASEESLIAAIKTADAIARRRAKARARAP